MDNKKILVSIIIPVFNGESYINDAYHNIINQNINNIEVIFVDNNSFDNSFKIIKKYTKKDTRVKLLTETKQGAAAARNTGIKYAKGDFIYFFDVDDQLYSDSIKILLDSLLMNPEYDTVFGNKTVSRDKLLNTKRSLDKIKVIEKENFYWGLKWFKNVNNLNGTPSFLHRKRVFHKIEPFNEGLMIGEDADFHIRLGTLCKVLYVDTLVYNYYRHSNSTVSQANRNSDKVFQYWPRIYKSHIPFFLNNKLPSLFERLLKRKVYGSVVKMIVLTRGFKKRQKIKNELYKQIGEVHKPFWFRLFVILALLFNSLLLYKFFVFKVLHKKVKV